MAYQVLAGLYDGLMEDIDYKRWADYLAQLLEYYHCPGQMLVDLGCGTGSISIPLAQKGYQVIGLDLSEEMLAKAAAKTKGQDLAVSWQQQDITELELAEEVDAMVATFDVFNHLLEPEDLQQTFLQISQYLRDDGLLIFDVQTPWKLREYLGNNSYSWHNEHLAYIWDNDFDEENQICTMHLTYFLQQDNGLYQRIEEEQYERVYELDLLQLWLDFAGFDVLGVYRQLTMEELGEQEERAVFVARKRKWDEDFDEDCNF